MTAAPVQIEITAWDAGECRVRVGGEIDMATVEELRTAFTEIVHTATPPCRVVVDLAGVAFLSAAGVRVLVQTGERVRVAGGVFVVDALSPVVETVLRACGYGHMVGITQRCG